MNIQHRFSGESRINVQNNQNVINFAADLLRQPVVFSGAVGSANNALREMLIAYHTAITANYKPYQNKSPEELKYNLARNEANLLADCLVQQHKTRKGLERVHRELSVLQRESIALVQPYYKARQKYIDYILQSKRESWLAGLPIASVNSDGLILEGLSRDESVYARLLLENDVFDSIGEVSYGCTYIDYAAELYSDLLKLRSYKNSIIQLGDFSCSDSKENDFRDRELDIPLSWMRSLLQINTALTKDLTAFRLKAMDIHNICLLVRQNKSKTGENGIKIQLIPGKPISIIIGASGTTLECPRSRYEGENKLMLSLWNRQDLLLLESLIPVVEEFQVFMVGSCMPVFVSASVGALKLVLGFSGWKTNDWSRLGTVNFMTPDNKGGEYMKIRALKLIKKTSKESVKSIADQLEISLDVARAVLQGCVQSGQIIYDMESEVYYWRPLELAPAMLHSIRYRNDKEKIAHQLLEEQQVIIDDVRNIDGYTHILGSVQEKVIRYQPDLIIGQDQSLINGSCYCSFYKRHKLKRGPCEHILALRILHSRL